MLQAETEPRQKEVEPFTLKATFPELPGVCVGLALLPRDAHLDAMALAKILGRHRRSIDRGAARGDLPPAILFFGKRVWTVGKILDYLDAKQTEACQKAARHAQRVLHN